MSKELMDCLLSDEEMGDFIEYNENTGMPRGISTLMSKVAKSQLQSPKLKAYISEQKRDVIKALGQYEMGVISTEECAKRIGINTVEFMELY